MPPKQSARRQSTLSFYGEDIIAYQELDPNETYVPIVTLCARLGLERAAQERRAHAADRAGGWPDHARAVPARRSAAAVAGRPGGRQGQRGGPRAAGAVPARVGLGAVAGASPAGVRPRG